MSRWMSTSPYAYHDVNDRASLYEGTRYIFATFEALEEMILFADRKPLVKTPDYEAARYDYNGKSMFVLVNLTDKPQQVTVEGIDGTWLEFRHNNSLNSLFMDLHVQNMPYSTLAGTGEKYTYLRK